MARTLEPYQMIERSIIKKYRDELWKPFVYAVKKYELIQAGDRIAVCISGGKDSMLMMTQLFDAGCTLINSCGDTVASMLVTRVLYGKDWYKKGLNEREHAEI